MVHLLTENEKRILQVLIEASSVDEVLYAVAGICDRKGATAREKWDDAAAEQWVRLARTAQVAGAQAWNIRHAAEKQAECARSLQAGDKE